MRLPTIALVLCAALLHAAWNLLLRRSTQSPAVTALMVGMGAVALAPFAFKATWSRSTVMIAMASALVEGAYFLLLAHAYRRHDVSAVYPVARGVAPVLVALAGWLFLDQRLSMLAIVGIGLTATGMIAIASSARIGPALGIATLIAAYSLIDGAAVQTRSPLPYLALVFAFTALLIVPYAVISFGIREIAWRRVIVLGAMMTGAYAAALAAMQTAPVAAVAASREVSIVFAVAGARLLLGEHVDRRRVFGAMVILIGTITIVLTR